jgi:hypothetical protein
MVINNHVVRIVRRILDELAEQDISLKADRKLQILFKVFLKE